MNGESHLPLQIYLLDRDENKMLGHGHSVVAGKVLADLMEKISLNLKHLQATAGRLAGLFDRTKQEIGEDTDQFAEILSSIDRHIDFLVRKIQILNRFSQRIVSSSAASDLGEVIEEAVLFSARLAHLHNVAIKLELDKDLPELHNDPVDLHFLVSSIINWMLTRMREGGKIIVKAKDEEEGLRIDVEGRGPLERAPSSERDASDRLWSIAQDLVKELGGRWESEADECPKKRISLFLPDTRALVTTQV